jgi:hypothetical protein
MESSPRATPNLRSAFPAAADPDEIDALFALQLAASASLVRNRKGQRIGSHPTRSFGRMTRVLNVVTWLGLPLTVVERGRA